MIKVSEVMSTNVLTLLDTATVAEARQLMSSANVRHLPVLNPDKEVIGLITQRDLLSVALSRLADVERYEREALESTIPISEVMTKNVTMVEEHTNLREAAQHMLDHKVGCLPVVEDGKLVGIVTESDFLRLVVNLLDRFQP